VLEFWWTQYNLCGVPRWQAKEQSEQLGAKKRSSKKQVHVILREKRPS
jgi:hypothetical protein